MFIEKLVLENFQERNLAGRWADGSHTADTVYDRRHVVGTRDPLDAVPVLGGLLTRPLRRPGRQAEVNGGGQAVRRPAAAAISRTPAVRGWRP